MLEPWPTTCSLVRFDCCPDVVPYPSGIQVWSEAVLSHTFEPQPSLVRGHFDDPAALDRLERAGRHRPQRGDGRGVRREANSPVDDETN